MNRSNLLRRLIGAVSVVVIVTTITFSGCTYIDDTLGSDLTLDDQSLKVGQLSFDCTEGNYFESRLFRTDSLSSSGLTYGYLGRMGNDTFGTRSASFYTQYLPSTPTFDEDDDDYDEEHPFGYMPIFDSAILYLSVAGYGGDTTVVQRFEVYEVIDDSFVTNSVDSVFFPNFNIDPYLSSEPVFTFSYPDYRNGIYVGSSTVTMQNTSLTSDFVDRLLLEKVTGDYDLEIFDEEEDWVEFFKGLYIRPAGDLEPITAGNAASLIATDLSASGFEIYGRTREVSDPTLIKDTITQAFVFYWSSAEAGNVMINKFDHNYDGSMININEVATPESDLEQIPLTSTLRIEGMAGVVSTITLTEEFFEQLDTILDAEEAATGELYTSLFFNQAQLKIYMQEVDSYDYTTIDPYLVTPWMNVMPSSLGMYTRYSYYLVDEDGNLFTEAIGDDDAYYTTLTGIADYLYTYESSYTLDYGGELNRTWGCYVMNISAHIQSCWNYYLDAKEEAEENGTDINWDDVEDRTIYLAPSSTSLNSFLYASLQAGDSEANSAPMYLELTYTMIR